jgi:hypothetical protein
MEFENIGMFLMRGLDAVEFEERLAGIIEQQPTQSSVEMERVGREQWLHEDRSWRRKQ